MDRTGQENRAKFDQILTIAPECGHGNSYVRFVNVVRVTHELYQPVGSVATQAKHTSGTTDQKAPHRLGHAEYRVDSMDRKVR